MSYTSTSSVQVLPYDGGHRIRSSTFQHNEGSDSIEVEAQSKLTHVQFIQLMLILSSALSGTSAPFISFVQCPVDTCSKPGTPYSNYMITHRYGINDKLYPKKNYTPGTKSLNVTDRGGLHRLSLPEVMISLHEPFFSLQSIHITLLLKANTSSSLGVSLLCISLVSRYNLTTFHHTEAEVHYCM